MLSTPIKAVLTSLRGVCAVEKCVCFKNSIGNFPQCIDQTVLKMLCFDNDYSHKVGKSERFFNIYGLVRCREASP